MRELCLGAVGVTLTQAETWHFILDAPNDTVPSPV